MFILLNLWIRIWLFDYVNESYQGGLKVFRWWLDVIGRGIGFFSLLLIDEMKWEKKKETPILVLIMLNDKFMSALSWKQTEG